MINSNYLVCFLNQVDILISEIDKLNSRIRLCKNNSKTFNLNFKSKITISPEYFIDLRNFLTKSIEDDIGYNRKIVELKREFSRSSKLIKKTIEKEIFRIEDYQEKEMNLIVYRAIYDAKNSYENKMIESYNISSSLIDRILGINKYRKLSMRNHELKAKLAKKQYEERKKEQKNIFELVNMIENTDIKTGELLCLQDSIIKAFMLDRNVIKRDPIDSWRPVMIIPHGFKAKIAHYKILNKNLMIENQELEKEIAENRLLGIENNKIGSKELNLINSKLNKMIKERIFKVEEV